jgi:molybdate transport system ATP-binding protein
MLDARFRKKVGPGAAHALTLEVTIRIPVGITVLFGSSGAGKTSILRAIAGISTPDNGRISLGGRIFFDSDSGINMPMQQRKVGYVFQHHTLFPHMTAEQNALYGADAGSRNSARERVQELFTMLGIQHAAPRYPHELSGGEQQRVALARALAADPDLMLLDEPLSAVDVATRSRLLEEIAVTQQKSGIPFLYVTHNPSEAVRLGNNMLVIDAGRVVQEGPPLEIFNTPKTAPVANAVGTENVFVARILLHKIEDGVTRVDAGLCEIELPYNGMPAGSQITIGIRSEDIIISRERITQTSARNILQGKILDIISDVDKTEILADCGIHFRVSVTRAAVRKLDLDIGTDIYLMMKARAFHVLA